MFKKVLVPLDLSDRNDRAIDVALELATTSGGELTLIHVIEFIPGLTYEAEGDFYRQLEENADRHMQAVIGRIRDRAAAAAVPIRVEVLFGSPGHVIVERATGLGSDLIVLTSHRVDIGGGKPVVGWGTQSYKIGIMAQCPVLLVK